MCSYVFSKLFNSKLRFQSILQRAEDMKRDDRLQDNEDNLDQLPVHHPLIKDRMSDEGLSP